MKRTLDSLRDRMSGCTEDELNIVLDILAIVAKESRGWTKRSDDAKRIPDVIWDCHQYIESHFWGEDDD